MNKYSPWLALPACVIIMACAQPASAAPVTYTYKGVVDFGNDDFGLFGQAGALLNGAAFTAVFTRDDDLAGPDGFITTPTTTIVSGYEGFRPLTGLVTINGLSFQIADVAYNQQGQYDDGEYESFNHIVQGGGASLSLAGFTLFPGYYDYLAGPDYHTLTSMTEAGRPGFEFNGLFEYTQAGSEGRTFARFNPASLTVSPDPAAAAVPEPGAWALMILGFGAAGAMLRRRRIALA